ncbi:MAG: hypothetical protein EZS28_001329 [Streblomastix strix]|uniref:Pep3/Vps18 beta-propeller domain-containing protein n=1 Tax=Streblomastix strix TaxID=222440 RepID=A0A5J4X7D0_9EUKA|nr:MAG: hypothetical protein EZS28_001329 [Streblomastix strix]
MADHLFNWDVAAPSVPPRRVQEQIDDFVKTSIKVPIIQPEVQPIFSLFQLDFHKPIPDKSKNIIPNITYMVAANDAIVAIAGNRIIRWTVQTADYEIYTIKLGKQNETIIKCFADPYCSNIFVSTSLGENYYIQAPGKENSAKHLPKWKLQIESMAFAIPLKNVQDKVQGFIGLLHGTSIPNKLGQNWCILIGTRDGRLLETTLENREKVPTEILSSVFQGFPIVSITGGIEINEQQPKYIVHVATALLRVELIRDKNEDQFQQANRALLIPTKFIPDPKDYQIPSEYVLGGTSSPNQQDPHVLALRPNWFAWLTSQGIFHSSVISYAQYEKNIMIQRQREQREKNKDISIKDKDKDLDKQNVINNESIKGTPVLLDANDSPQLSNSLQSMPSSFQQSQTQPLQSKSKQASQSGKEQNEIGSIKDNNKEKKEKVKEKEKNNINANKQNKQQSVSQYIYSGKFFEFEGNEGVNILVNETEIEGEDMSFDEDKDEDDKEQFGQRRRGADDLIVTFHSYWKEDPEHKAKEKV